MEVTRPSTVWAITKAGKKLLAMGVSHNDEFRDLVQQLMDAGWYRVGHEEGPGGVSWQFQQGHTLETSTGSERWIVAPDEMAAMRILWDEVSNERATEES